MSSTVPRRFERDRGGHGLLIVLAEARQAFGDDIAGQDGIDGDAVFGELDAGGAHEAELAGFGGAVMRPAGKAGDRAGDR